MVDLKASNIMIYNRAERINHALKYPYQHMGLANHERLCKINETFYIICRDFCCGEFWESKGPFCCPNNFKPLRNLFFFLLASFVGLFAFLMMYLMIESLVKCSALDKIKKLEDIYLSPRYSDFQTLDKEWQSSDEDSLDEDSSLDSRPIKYPSRPPSHVLTKHSQSFKDMSRLRSSKKRKVRELKN